MQKSHLQSRRNKSYLRRKMIYGLVGFTILLPIAFMMFLFGLPTVGRERWSSKSEGLGRNPHDQIFTKQKASEMGWGKPVGSKNLRRRIFGSTGWWQILHLKIPFWKGLPEETSEASMKAGGCDPCLWGAPSFPTIGMQGSWAVPFHQTSGFWCLWRREKVRSQRSTGCQFCMWDRQAVRRRGV